MTIPYPWNLGEPIEIALLTSTGLTFEYGIEVAAETPKVTAGALGRFALMGIFVGVIPVGLGMTWFPFLRRLGRRSLGFLLYLTVGLLAFLVVDAWFEGLEVAAELPGIYHGAALLILGFAGSRLLLFGIQARGTAKRDAASSGVVVAWLIARGIGLHNLGEGLAIGSAYVLGELTLGHRGHRDRGTDPQRGRQATPADRTRRAGRRADDPRLLDRSVYLFTGLGVAVPRHRRRRDRAGHRRDRRPPPAG